MHPRSPFHTPLDLHALAEKHAGLAADLLRSSDGSLTVNWTSPTAAIALSAALLVEYAGIQRWSVPGDRLCPPVPNRLSYLLFAEDLVASRIDPRSWRWDAHASAPTSDGASSVAGNTSYAALDVGTGASAILALLGHRMLGWRVMGTDTDVKSLLHARELLRSNSIDDAFITLRRVLVPGELLPSGDLPQIKTETILQEALQAAQAWKAPHGCATQAHAVDVTVCNPPFFATEAEARSSVARAASKAAAFACTGSASEMVTPGGESAFVFRMMQESHQLHTVQTSATPTPATALWYTSMLGKHNSIAKLWNAPQRFPGMHMRMTELYQGHTTRWAIGWTYALPCDLLADGWQFRDLSQASARPRTAAAEGADTGTTMSSASAGTKRAREDAYDSDVDDSRLRAALTEASAGDADAPIPDASDADDRIADTAALFADVSGAPAKARRSDKWTNLRCFHMAVRGPADVELTANVRVPDVGAGRLSTVPNLAGTAAIAEQLQQWRSAAYGRVGSTDGASAALPTLSEIIQRVQEAVASGPWLAEPGVSLDVWRHTGAPCVHAFHGFGPGTALHPVSSRLLDYAANRSLDVHVAAVFRGDATHMDDAGATACLFRFEVQVVHLRDAGRGNTDVKRRRVAAYDGALVIVNFIAGSRDARPMFLRLFDRIQRDTVRTGRAWRRKMQRTAEAAVDAV